jgi:hypothetical protein
MRVKKKKAAKKKKGAKGKKSKKGAPTNKAMSMTMTPTTRRDSMAIKPGAPVKTPAAADKSSTKSSTKGVQGSGSPTNKKLTVTAQDKDDSINLQTGEGGDVQFSISA